MKKMQFVVPTMLLGLSFASASFATPLTVEYKHYVAYINGACPESITQLIDDDAPLVLTYDVPMSEGTAKLTGTTTPGVIVTSEMTLDPMPDYGAHAFRSNNATSTTLKIVDTSFLVTQAWIDKSSETASWESAFYLNKNKSCLVMTSPEAETNRLAQPTG